MSGYWHAPDDYQSDPQTFSGSAHSVSGIEPGADVGEQLRKVVEEVMRKPCAAPPVRRMGFL